MSTPTTDQVSNLLARLDSAIGKKGKSTGKKDFAAAKAAFWKPKEGKNTILVITPTGSEDPFTFWGFHKGLQEVDYYSVPCDHYNRGEDCLVCNVEAGLKKENWEGNKHLWLPIEQKTETYAPIIDYTNAATIAEGPKWFRISKTIMDQIVNSIKNLEEGEVPFYDQSAPQRLVINYDKNQAPATMYSVSFKLMKESEKPSEEQFEEWASKVQPVSEFIFSKSQEQIKKIVDEYFVRVASEIDNSISTDEEDDTTPFEAETAPAVKSKLDKLKK